MRITEGVNYQMLLQNIARAQERVQRAQSEVSSGKKVINPSDDPTAASDIIRLTSETTEADQFSKNLTFAQSKLQITDSVLDNVEQMVLRAKSLGELSFGNPTAGQASFTEVKGLRDQIIAAANTTHAGRFLFSGSLTTTAPYVKNPDSTVTYQGNDQDVRLQVDRNTTLSMQIPGSQIFTGSVDIFRVMSDLSAAMQSGDKAGIDTQLKRIQQFEDVISVARSKVGGYMNLATSVQNTLSSSNLARANELSKEQDADMAKAISQLTLSQNGLQATLAVGARISQLSLLDYLK